MAVSRVIIVTGANKGIGYAIVRQLALQYPSSSLNAGGPLLIYLTARDPSRGEAALRSMLEDAALQRAGVLLSQQQHEPTKDGSGSGHGNVEIKFKALDIAQTASITEFRDFLRSAHPDGIDALVNNAGIALDGFNASVAATTLAVNYHGTLHLTRTLLPLVRRGGRVVTVASKSGRLAKYSAGVRARFLAAGTTAEVDALMAEFEEAVAEGRVEERGFPGNTYAVSKAGAIAAAGVVAREVVAEGRGVLVNSCCPGWVDTDMTKHRGTKTPDQGAQTPVWLAIGDIGGEYGKFWENGKVTQW